jgi:N-acetylglutamate synthase-like GNAT family acetyltransferase
MIARVFNVPRDLYLIEGKDIDPMFDIISVVEVGGKVAGSVALRPCLFVHDFEVQAGALSRQVTDTLLSYAMGAARAMGHREAIVIVAEDKVKMRSWWEEHGAVQQPTGAVYMVEIK